MTSSHGLSGGLTMCVTLVYMASITSLKKIVKMVWGIIIMKDQPDCCANIAVFLLVDIIQNLHSSDSKIVNCTINYSDRIWDVF